MFDSGVHCIFSLHSARLAEAQGGGDSNDLKGGIKYIQKTSEQHEVCLSEDCVDPYDHYIFYLFFLNYGSRVTGPLLKS